MYLLVSLLIYATPFVVGALLIFLVVALPALSRRALETSKTSSTRPELAAEHEFETGFAGSPDFHATHS